LYLLFRNLALAKPLLDHRLSLVFFFSSVEVRTRKSRCLDDRLSQICGLLLLQRKFGGGRERGMLLSELLGHARLLHLISILENAGG
jgi:hypothetical protein